MENLFLPDFIAVFLVGEKKFNLYVIKSFDLLSNVLPLRKMNCYETKISPTSVVCNKCRLLHYYYIIIELNPISVANNWQFGMEI